MARRFLGDECDRRRPAGDRDRRPAPRTAEVSIVPVPAPVPQTQEKEKSAAVSVALPASPTKSPDDAVRSPPRWYGRLAAGDPRALLRDEMFQQDPNAWQSFPLEFGPEPDIATIPLSSHELLKQLLKGPAADGEVNGRSGLEPVKPSGAES